MADAPRQYPACCPKCEAASGYPFQVRTLAEKPGHIEVKLRCRDCRHEWIDIVAQGE